MVWVDLGDLVFYSTSTHSFMIERPTYGSVHRWVVRSRADGRVLHEATCNGMTRAKAAIKPFIKQYKIKVTGKRKKGRLFMASDGQPYG